MNQIITDNVNLCYVAMTRPVERLYIQNNFESTKFGELFHKTLLSSGLAQESDGKLTVTINDGDRSPIKQAKESASLFEPDEVTDRLWFPDIAFQDNPDLNTADFLSDEMQFGIQFHLLTSRINSVDEIKNKVDEGIHSGEISVANSKQLIERLTKLYNLAEYQSLISNNIQVLNEQAILVDENTMARPDKIVIKADETIIIDFKTGLPKNKDEKQIKSYQNTLVEMGYPNVSCYLYYSSIAELRQMS